MPRGLQATPLLASTALGVVKRLAGAVLLTLALIILPPLLIGTVVLVALALAMEAVKLL